MIEVKNVHFSYGETEVLKDVSFTIEQGEWISVVGHNGSGKSTLLKLIAGIEIPSKGTITINHIPVDESHIYDIHKQLGIVFQNPDNQFVGTTVEMDIAFGMENYGVEHDEMHKRVDEVLEAVNMTAFKTHEPHFLSGGQKQRIAIAGILALRPNIIILDEATSMLDPAGREDILNVVKSLQEKYRFTVIHITHYLDETLTSDRIFVMNQGELMMTGTPEAVFNQGEKLIKIGLSLPFAMEVYYTLYGDVRFISESELYQLL